MNPCHRARLRASALVLAASAALIAGPSASAALLAYEPFNYTPGLNHWTDAGQVQSTASLGGDFGWKEAWRSGGTANDTNIQVLGGSFGYSVGGRSLVTAGNRMWVSGDASAAGDNFGGVNATVSPYRRMNFAAQRGFGNSQTTWISFLADLGTVVPGNYTGIGSGPGGTVSYARGVGAFQMFGNAADNVASDDPAMGNNGQGNENLSVGRGTQSGEVTSPGGADLNLPNDTWGMLNRGGAAQSVVSNTPLTTLVFILMRINHATGTNPTIGGQGDVAYAWINPPSLTTEPSTATGLLITPSMFDLPHPVGVTPANDRDYNFNRIRIFGGNQGATGIGYSSMIVDEFRIGETFADVTPNVIPEPSSAILAVLGVVALGARRRK